MEEFEEYSLKNPDSFLFLHPQAPNNSHYCIQSLRDCAFFPHVPCLLLCFKSAIYLMNQESTRVLLTSLYAVVHCVLILYYIPGSHNEPVFNISDTVGAVLQHLLGSVDLLMSVPS